VQKGTFFHYYFSQSLRSKSAFCDSESWQQYYAHDTSKKKKTMPMTAYTTVQEQYYFGHSSLEAHCVVEILTFETFVGIVDGLARALCGNERGPLVSL